MRNISPKPPVHTFPHRKPQTKWRCCYILSTGVHTLTQSTTHAVEL